MVSRSPILTIRFWQARTILAMSQWKIRTLLTQPLPFKTLSFQFRVLPIIIWEFYPYSLTFLITLNGAVHVCKCQCDKSVPFLHWNCPNRKTLSISFRVFPSGQVTTGHISDTADCANENTEHWWVALIFWHLKLPTVVLSVFSNVNPYILTNGNPLNEVPCVA